jgi:hypothetical protein
MIVLIFFYGGSGLEWSFSFFVFVFVIVIVAVAVVVERGAVDMVRDERLAICFVSLFDTVATCTCQGDEDNEEK